MKLGITARRRLDSLLFSLNDDLAQKLLTSFELDGDVLPENRLASIDEKLSREWSVSNSRKVWSIAEVSNFLNSWLKISR